MSHAHGSMSHCQGHWLWPGYSLPVSGILLTRQSIRSRGVGDGIAVGRAHSYTSAMCTDKETPRSPHDGLIALVDHLQLQVGQLTAANEELQKQLAAAQRAGKRQAAPFSKGERTSKPRRPGRKPGTGNFSYRKPPPVDELTAPPVDVAVAAESCPGCGGILEHDGESLAYVTDIPPMPRPQVTEYRVQIPYRGTGQACRCVSCGRRVRGRHPEVGPDQYGASAHRVGRRVMAAAHMLHYGVGIPVRRVPAVLRALTGVELSQSAITQDALRRARGAVGDAYHRLRESVRESAVVHTDDTGWRVGGESALPQGFCYRSGAIASRICYRNQVVAS